MQFTVPYQGDEDGLPNEDEYEKLINRLFKNPCTIDRTSKCFFFAGHFYLQSSGKNAFLL